MTKEVLPLGSVVRLSGEDDALFMIAGYEPQSDGDMSDYLGVVYPEGIVDEGSALAFDSEAIAEVVHYGYLDDEGKRGFEAVRRYRRISEEAIEAVELLIDRLTPDFIQQMRDANAPIPLPEGFEVPEGYEDLPI